MPAKLYRCPWHLLLFLCLVPCGNPASINTDMEAVCESNSSRSCEAAAQNRSKDQPSALETLRQRQAELQKQVKANAFNMSALWEMCDLKLRESRLLEGLPPGMSASAKAADCLQTFVSAVQMTQTLARSAAKQHAATSEDGRLATAKAGEEEDEDEDLEELPFVQYFQYASVASQRLLILSDGSIRRFESGVKFLGDVLKNSSYCHNVTVQHALVPHIAALSSRSCSVGFADFILMQKLVYGDDPSPGERRELQKHWNASQALPHPFAWSSADQLHIQLPGIRAIPIWTCQELPSSMCSWVQDLETNTPVIEAELREFLDADGSPLARGMDAASVNAHIGWRMPDWSRCRAGQVSQDSAGKQFSWPRWVSLTLLVNGRWNRELCTGHFSSTCKLLENRPELDAGRFKFPWDGENSHLRGNVSTPVLMVHLYRLSPGTRLRPHFGTHGRLVISLGLLGTEANDTASIGNASCKEGACGALLRVGGEERRWSHGKAQIFDDAFEHEVQLPCGAPPRYVLAASVLHPDVSSNY